MQEDPPQQRRRCCGKGEQRQCLPSFDPRRDFDRWQQKQQQQRRQAEIRIYRCGSRPSTSYLMQESVIVDGVLDELQNLAGLGGATTTGTTTSSTTSDENEEPEIADEDRLLIPDPENAIEEARESLAFG
mmetsp:Transcript_16059/g.34795  ORF Transcript_16059/g.34795 Transcript_16059/m.34795 type:complete len:130 (-) Transcript_16059:91-480(-)